MHRVCCVVVSGATSSAYYRHSDSYKKFDHFQNGRQKVAVKKQIIIAGLKIHSNVILSVINRCNIYCRHNFYFIAYNLCKFKMATKTAAKSCF